MPSEWNRDRVDAEITALGEASRRLSAARFFVFLAFLLTAVVAVSWPWGAIPAAGLLGFFAVLVARHERCERGLRLWEARRVLVCEREARHCRRDLRGDAPAIPADPLPLELGAHGSYGDEGGEDLDPQVLDDFALLAGPVSVFGFLDATSTPFGAWRLRRLLSRSGTDPTVIRRRQESVAELGERRDARDDLLERLVPLRRHAFTAVPRALRAPWPFAGRHGLRHLSRWLGNGVLALLVAGFFVPPLWLVAGIVVLANICVIAMNVADATKSRARLRGLTPLLDGLLVLDAGLRELTPRSVVLSEVAERSAEAAPTWQRLRRRLARLELRQLGVLSEFINILFLWELRVLPVAEAALLAERERLEGCIADLGEVEALLSLSGPLCEQDGFVLPEPDDAPTPRLDAVALGHPLLVPESLVRNSLSLGDESTVLLITGSNMAGKSTFLKSAGTNLVLAGAGGPVCAESFRWSPIVLHSDVNVRDSLAEGKSSFQVEVERVRSITDRAREDRRMLVVFDELLRGTNSRERIAIAAAIIRHLRDCGVLLLVATHDLALASLVTEDHEPGMECAHFEERIDGDVMTFDYRMKPGRVTTRNAIRVLEISGYDPGIVAEAQRRHDLAAAAETPPPPTSRQARGEA